MLKKQVMTVTKMIKVMWLFHGDTNTLWSVENRYSITGYGLISKCLR